MKLRWIAGYGPAFVLAVTLLGLLLAIMLDV